MGGGHLQFFKQLSLNRSDRVLLFIPTELEKVQLVKSVMQVILRPSGTVRVKIGFEKVRVIDQEVKATVIGIFNTPVCP